MKHTKDKEDYDPEFQMCKTKKDAYKLGTDREHNYYVSQIAPEHNAQLREKDREITKLKEALDRRVSVNNSQVLQAMSIAMEAMSKVVLSMNRDM